MAWQTFALMTVFSWGIYGVLLHSGRLGMLKAGDPANASMKAFLLVGIAYFVVAIVGPVFVLMANKTNWKFTGAGLSWSFVAGTAGAIGAFTLILALGAAAKGGASTANVMSLVFGGAPVVNALVSMMAHPPEGGLKSVPLGFWHPDIRIAATDRPLSKRRFIGVSLGSCGGRIDSDCDGASPLFAVRREAGASVGR